MNEMKWWSSSESSLFWQHSSQKKSADKTDTWSYFWYCHDVLNRFRKFRTRNVAWFSPQKLHYEIQIIQAALFPLHI